MALQSALVALGTPAPDFALPDLSGDTVCLGDFDDHSVLVVVFACNHCPYVQHIEDALGALGNSYDDVAFVAICSNNTAAYPEDDAEHLRTQAQRAQWSFPYLIDETQDVARAFGAVCTPDFFVYGPDRRLSYRGAFDGSTPGNGVPVDASLVRGGIKATLMGHPALEPHRPSMGCGIKWKDDAQ